LEKNLAAQLGGLLAEKKPNPNYFNFVFPKCCLALSLHIFCMEQQRQGESDSIEKRGISIE
jgi:hypothetical protein